MGWIVIAWPLAVLAVYAIAVWSLKRIGETHNDEATPRPKANG